MGVAQPDAQPAAYRSSNHVFFCVVLNLPIGRNVLPLVGTSFSLSTVKPTRYLSSSVENAAPVADLAIRIRLR